MGQQFDKQGAIKTKDGIMLYVNIGAESEIDLNVFGEPEMIGKNG